MKKIIIACVVVVVAIGGYFMINRKGNTETPLNQTNQDTSVSETGGKKIAFSEFIKQGGSYKCEVNQYLEGMGGSTTKGITYLGNGMIRGEYNTQTQGFNIDSTVIVRDGYTYSWSSMAPTMGFKIKAVENTNTDAAANASGSYAFNADQIGDYSCEAWTLDASKFELPSSITFKEV